MHFQNLKDSKKTKYIKEKVKEALLQQLINTQVLFKFQETIKKEYHSSIPQNIQDPYNYRLDQDTIKSKNITQRVNIFYQ